MHADVTCGLDGIVKSVNNRATSIVVDLHPCKKIQPVIYCTPRSAIPDLVSAFSFA